MEAAALAEAIEATRPELTAYLTRMVVRVEVAEELMQEAALRALRSAAAVPDDARPWLFRVASNLAIDHRRRHGTLRETLLTDARRAAESSPEFDAATRPLRGSPEAAAVAREHLTACFSCTLGQLPAEHAAALLLKEAYGFSNQEIADLLDARFAQVKNWLQQARAEMAKKFESRCALIHKQGVCYQCPELADMFGAAERDPLAGTAGTVDDRLRVIRQARAEPAGAWTRLLSGLLDDLL